MVGSASKERPEEMALERNVGFVAQIWLRQDKGHGVWSEVKGSMFGHMKTHTTTAKVGKQQY
jgi:hypothetical protein